jgi:hypothetical protein
MMRSLSVVCIFAVLLVSSSLAGAVEFQKSEGKISIVNKTSGVKSNKNDSVDGTTSASKLRAKKSHSVSKQDEMGLTIFFGLIVLSVMAFFLKPFSEKK